MGGAHPISTSSTEPTTTTKGGLETAELQALPAAPVPPRGRVACRDLQGSRPRRPDVRGTLQDAQTPLKRRRSSIPTLPSRSSSDSIQALPKRSRGWWNLPHTGFPPRPSNHTELTEGGGGTGSTQAIESRLGKRTQRRDGSPS